MKAAIVAQAGSSPVYGDFKEPVPSSGKAALPSPPQPSALW